MSSTALALQCCWRNSCSASEFFLPLTHKKYFPWNKMETILLILKKSTSATQWETVEGRWKHWKQFGKESRTPSFQIVTFDFVLVISQILSLFLLLQHLQSNQRTQYNYNSAQESFQRLYWILSATDFVIRDRKPGMIKYGVGMKISDPAAREQQTILIIQWRLQFCVWFMFHFLWRGSP